MKKIIILLLIICLSLSSFVYASTADDLRDSCEAYYDFEEVASPMVDRVGNVDSTCTNCPSFGETGIIGDAMRFYKTNSDYFVTDANTVFNTGTDNFTMCFWYKLPATGVNTYLLGQWDTTPKFGLQITATNKLTAWIAFTDAATRILKTGDNAINLDTNWHFYCHGRNNTADGTVFRDGVEFSTTDAFNGNANMLEDIMFFGAIDAGAQVFDVYLDEFSFYNESLTILEKLYLWNAGAPTSAQQFPFSVSSLVITLDYPNNETHYNLDSDDPTKKYNGFINLTTNFNVNCTVNDSDFSLKTTGGLIHEFENNTAIIEKNYSITVNCSGGSLNSTTEFWFIIDPIVPTINTNLINNSIQGNPFNLNVVYFDKYLFRTNTTLIRDSDGLVVFNNFSGDLGGFNTTYNVTEFINISNSTFPIGAGFTLFTEATDTHTANKFKEKPEKEIISFNDKKIKIYKLKYGDFRIEYDKDLTIDEKYTYDRMHFIIKTDKLKDKYVSKYIEADSLFYIPESEYDCHFIVNNKYWYDCEGLSNPVVTKINKKRYRIDFYMDGSEVITKSLGGLNEVNKTYHFTSIFNTTSNITVGTILNPPFVDFFYNVSTEIGDANWVAVNGTCVIINGGVFDGVKCYNKTLLELQNITIFPQANTLDCYLNMDHDQLPYTINYEWLNKAGTVVRSGINLCESDVTCTVDTLPASLIFYNQSYSCRVTFNEDYFYWSNTTDSINTSSIGECNGINTYPLINISYFNEITKDAITTNASFELSFFGGSGVTMVNFSTSGNYSDVVCTDVNPAAKIINLDMFGTITLKKQAYVTRVINIPFATSIDTSNNPYTKLSLFLIEISNSTTITFTWQTTSFEFIDGTMVIYECNLDGTRSLIDSTPISSGLAYANLQLLTTPYSYEVVIGTDIFTEAAYNDCHVENVNERTYYVNVEPFELLPVVGLFLVDCGVEKTAPQIVKMEWAANPNDPSDITGCIVGKRQTLQGLVEVYRNCTTGSTGSFQRIVPTSTSAYTVFGEITQNNLTTYCQNTVSFNINLGTAVGIGLTGIFGIVLAILGIGLMFDRNNDLRLLSSGFMIVIGFILQFINVQWLTIVTILFIIFFFILIGRYTAKRRQE